ncbi:ABC transporter permease [Kineosporia rhizophila]|uniref:ABC transporter permease n=1 Tax=Kineosporia rhizophila TaxID=84633 RepID=UPI001E3A396A|nr:ABC transporter permease [Kineosporia rhizophila]MCE0536304.1 ABC transporter permease [Kineosporia rhizophila]
MATETPAAVPVTAALPRRRSFLGALWRHRSSRVGLILAGFTLAVALIGPFLVLGSASSDPNHQDLSQSLLGSSSGHWLGTDDLGRDELVRIVNGARYTLVMAVAAVAIAAAAGLVVGAVSGYAGGWTDLVIQRLVDIILSFPGFLMALSLVAILGTGMTNLIIAVAVSAFPRFVRVTRSGVLTVMRLPYVEAARSQGLPPLRILRRHVVPNALGALIVQTPLEIGSAVLTGAGLGFLGLGVAEPTPEWGAMLGDGRDLLFTDPTLVTYPGIAIFVAILGFNLLGDGIRDVLDPRHSTSR